MPRHFFYANRIIGAARRHAAAVSIWALLGALATAAVANPFVFGPARFTVVTPECVRLEYAPAQGFVDAPTLFAINRSALDSRVKATQSADSLVIDTGRLRLVYRPDGRPFSAVNLQVTFQNGSQPGHWTPGLTATGNLGGPVATLDGVGGPMDLPPGLISRDGWAVVDDSGRPLRIDGWIAPRKSDSSGSADQDIDWYLFAYGHDYAGALQSLSAISGRAAMPRKEVLGSWYCRWHKYTADDFRQIVQGYDDHDFPLDILVMDMDWHTQDAKVGHGHANNLGWTGYTWNRTLLPDPTALLREFRNKGIYVTLNDHPADGMRDHEENYSEFIHLLGDGYPQNPPFNAGDKHYMDAFFAASHAPLEAQGVDFWWLDWQQDYTYPSVPGVPGLRHLPWLNELYFLQSEKSGLRGQDYTRWGGWGDQRHPIQFSGDASSNWEMLAFEVPFTLTSGNAGCFFWAHDTGGFYGARNPEMYTRWTQFSGLAAALRVHSVGDDTDRRPWLWGQQDEDAMRVVYHLRSQLFPYIYTSVRQCYDQTLPLLRPLYLVYPDQEPAYHYSGEYLLGDNLLAAPIVSPGAGPALVAAQSVWFPQGDWYNFFTGERYTGGQEAVVSADIDESPLYVRGGVPIPMQPYTPRMTSTPLTTLRVRCCPGEDGKTGVSSLYEDDGRTSAYQEGAFSRTPLTYTRRGNMVVVTVGAAVGRFEGQVLRRSVVIELADTAKAVWATVDGKAVISQYDQSTQTNTVALPAGQVDRPLTVKVACGPADTEALRASAISRRVQGIFGASAPGGADPKTLLAPYDTLPPASQEALLATLGIDLVKRTDGPNFASGPAYYVFFAPSGLLDRNQVTVSGERGNPVIEAFNGGALPVAGPGTERKVAAVDFSIAGQPFRLQSGPIFGPDDVALDAKATASSCENGHTAEGAIDGLVGGYPNDPGAEWSSGGEKAGATLRLDWEQPQTVDRIALYDRPNSTDHVTSGQLTFSDGTTLPVGELNKDKIHGIELRFPPKTITWITFEVTGVSPNTQNAGLAEIAVYRAH